MSKLTDERIDDMWILRGEIHGGDLTKQLRDFARNIEREVLAAQEVPSAGAVAWLHEIVEPAEQATRLLSMQPDNPWNHWMDSYRKDCVYRVTPLYTHPEPVAAQPSANHDAYLTKLAESCGSHTFDSGMRAEFHGAAQPSAEVMDTERLDFMLANDAFTVRCNRDGSILQYQLMTQDEDENHHVLHNERRFFNTEREAIDAAIVCKAASDIAGEPR